MTLHHVAAFLAIAVIVGILWLAAAGGDFDDLMEDEDGYGF